MSRRARLIASTRRLARDFSVPAPGPGAGRALVRFLAVVSIGFVLQVLARQAGWPLAFPFA